MDFLRSEYVYPPREEELYDLAADPWETNDLAGRPDRRDLLERARHAMDRIPRFAHLYTESRSAEPQKKLDPQMIETLRALGYIK